MQWIGLLLAGILGADEGKTLSDEQILAKREFLKLYALDDCENLRHIRPPYSNCRLNYFSRYPQAKDLGRVAKHLQCAVLRWSESDFGFSMAGGVVCGDHASLHVAYVLQKGLGFNSHEIEGGDDLLKSPIPGDFVVRTGVPREKLLADFARVLSSHFAKPVEVEIKELGRPVYVAKGTWNFSPEDPKSKCVFIGGYRSEDDTVLTSSQYGDFTRFLDDAASWVGVRFVADGVWEVPKQLEWRLYQPGGKFSPLDERYHRGGEAVVNFLTRQTGLKFTRSIRKVNVLVVSKRQ